MSEDIEVVRLALEKIAEARSPYDTAVTSRRELASAALPALSRIQTELTRRDEALEVLNARLDEAEAAEADIARLRKIEEAARAALKVMVRSTEYLTLRNALKETEDAPT